MPPKSEKYLYAPGPGSIFWLATELLFLGDLLNDLQRLFLCIELKKLPFLFKFYFPVSYAPGPGISLDFYGSYYFMLLIFNPGVFDTVDSIYLPVVFIVVN